VLIVLGGTTVAAPFNPQSAVYASGINSNGTLSGWTQVATLPTALRLQSASIAVSSGNSYVVVAGGRDSSNIRQDLVYTASLSGTGVVGTFVTQATLDSLPVPLDSQSMIAVGANLLVTGGTNATGISSSVYSAPIGTDGMVGSNDCRTQAQAECWMTSYNALPQARAQSGAADAFGTVVVTGGYDSSTSPTSSVFTIPFNVATGTLGSGAPATVAVVIPYDVNAGGQAESDLQTYRAFYGLPTCTTANGCFKSIKFWQSWSRLDVVSI
jgi:hypothetical protein